MRPLSWFLFILSTGVLYVRPQEWYPDSAVQLFLPVVVPALLVSIGAIFDQLNSASLVQRPITVYVLGILLICLFADLVNARLQAASDFLDGFGKTILFYLLLVGVIDTPARLRSFLFWLAIWYMVAMVPIFLDHQGVIHLPGIKHASDFFIDPVTGQRVAVKRLTGTGLFGDPNDICLNLSTAVFLCLYGVSQRASGIRRFLWLLPLGFFGYCIKLTGSRGGVLMIFAGILALVQSRYRGKKKLLIAIVVLPVLFVALSGRQGSISVSSGTGRQRVEMWSAGLYSLRSSPLWGFGTGSYVEMFDHVAHNSYVQAYVETGFMGGTLFFGAVFYALTTLYRLGSDQVTILDPELTHLRPYVVAILASYATGMLSLTENFLVPTWGILGLATVFVRLADTDPPLSGTQFNGQFVKRTLLGSVGFLVAIQVFIRVNSRF